MNFSGSAARRGARRRRHRRGHVDHAQRARASRWSRPDRAIEVHAFGTVRVPPVRISALRSQRVVGWGAPRAMTTLRYSVVAIFGPTASGKSDVAHELAMRLRTEVVSADALQVYDGIPILTNQSHHPTRLTAIRPLSAEMSVGEYAEARARRDRRPRRGARSSSGRRRDGPVPARGARGPRDPRSRRPRDARARLEAMYDADPAGTHAHLERSMPPPPRRCT